eukprot:SAG31_NODE_14383_length_810_cov_0.891702_1_plen_173_part_00
MPHLSQQAAAPSCRRCSVRTGQRHAESSLHFRSRVARRRGDMEAIRSSAGLRAAAISLAHCPMDCAAISACLTAISRHSCGGGGGLWAGAKPSPGLTVFIVLFNISKILALAGAGGGAGGAPEAVPRVARGSGRSPGWLVSPPGVKFSSGPNENRSDWAKFWPNFKYQLPNF